MNLEQLKAKAAELRTKIAELKAGDQTAENATAILDARQELKTVSAEITTIESALADDDVDNEPKADADDDADKDKSGDEPANPPADQPGKDGTPATDPVTPDPNPGSGETADDVDKDKTGSGDAATPPVSMAASGTDVSPTVAPPATKTNGFALVASAGAAGIASPGDKLDRAGALSVLQAAFSHAGASSNGRVRLFGIDRYPNADPASIPSMDKSAIENSRLLAAARARNERPTTLSAAGCFCGPDELVRRTGLEGQTGRPIAGIFPGIGINNGGFRAMPDLAFNDDLDLRSGLTQWDCDKQALLDADPDNAALLKPCAEVRCFTEATYEPYMIPACVTVSTMHRWAHPEQIDVWMDLLAIEYDSLAETILLDILENDVAASGGAPLTVGVGTGQMNDHGLMAKLIYVLGQLGGPLGYEFRSTGLEGYVAIVPRNTFKAVLADEKLRGFPSGLDSEEAIRAFFQRSFGVRFVERLDEATSQKTKWMNTVTAIRAGGAVDAPGGVGDNDAAETPLMPDTLRIYLVDPSSWVHGEGTLVAADWYTDDKLVRSNKIRYFLENVELLVRLGKRRNYILDVPFKIMGSYSDLVAAPGL